MDLKVKELFDDAQKNISKGDMAMALACCNKIDSKGSKYPDVSRMKGFIDMYNNNIESAIDNFENAVKISSNQEVHVLELLTVYIEVEQYEKAIELGEAPEFANLYNVLALLCIAYLKNPNSEAFLEHYKKIHNLDVSSPYIFMLKGMIAQEEKKYNDAIKHYNNAIKLKPDYVSAYLRLAGAFLLVEKSVESLIANKKALSIRPANKVALNNLIYISTQLNLTSEALPNVVKAMSILGDYEPLCVFMASVHNNSKNIEKALEYCDKAIVTNEVYLPAYNLKATILERSGRLEEARGVVNKGLEFSGNHSGLYCNLAVIENREGNYEQAMEYIKKADELHTANDTVKFDIIHNKAYILDNMQQYRESFSTFSESQEGFKKIWEHKPFKGNEFNSEEEAKYYTKERIDGWKEKPYNGKSPVFFMGFMRSGTTLVEEALSSHSNALVFSEGNSINTIASNMGEILGKRHFYYPNDVDSLTEEEVDKLRDYYWDIMRVKAFRGEDIEGKKVIDKYPLSIAYLGLIYRLFPNAKILVAIRDPRDVCISCFFQNFDHKSALPNFHTMDGTVDFYNEVMGLYLKLKENVPLDIKEYRYEDLVGNKEDVLKGILEFFGLTWEENVMDFYNEEGVVKTPGYADIVKPLFSPDIAKWKNYEPELSEYLPKLEKYVKEFEYENS